MRFLMEDLHCPKLACMAENLWVLSTHSHKNITPLHRQRLRGREIVVMEDPGLHLVWIHDRIYIKPLPRYLLSYDFWTHVLLEETTAACGPRQRGSCGRDGAREGLDEDRVTVAAAARGLLRSYYFLIQYESDFRIAQRDDLQLVPAGVTYEQFCTFCTAFAEFTDDEVTMRYEYGELRLTRLNLWAPALLGAVRFRHVGLQYIDDFAPYFTPLLFVFAVMAILLNAMQVALAVEAIDAVQDWAVFNKFSRWFAVLSIILAVVPSLALLLLLGYKILDEWVYALRQRRRRRRGGGKIADHQVQEKDV